MEDTRFDETEINTVRRYKHRAEYDKQVVYDIIRSVPVLSVAFVDNDDSPQIVPMVGAIEETEDEVFCYLHGSSVSRFIKSNESGKPMTVNATFVDGYILSLTPYSHDVQYRSATLHCITFPFSDTYDKNGKEAAKLSALELITDSILPNRYQATRVPPTKTEITATGVLRLKVISGSAKINTEGASDSTVDMSNEENLDKIWTGVLPFKMVPLDPIPSEYNRVKGNLVPSNVLEFKTTFEQRFKAGLNAVPK